MQTLRTLYVDAMNQARGSGGVGWVERERSVSVFDEQAGMQVNQPQYARDDESGQWLFDAAGQPQVTTERLFDPDIFTAWYESQPGLPYQAFKSIYGASRTHFDRDEYGNTFVSSIAFDNPHWAINLVSDGVMRTGALTGIDLNHPPELIDRSAIGFDLEVGWATPPENLEPEDDWLWTLGLITVVGVMTWGVGLAAEAAAYGAGLTTVVEGATVLSTTGIVVTAAMASAGSALVSGVVNGNVSLKGILTSAVSGALTAGLTQLSGASGVLRVVQNTLVQGGVQALLGGSFEQGALTAFFSSVGSLVTSNMSEGIDQAFDNGSMNAEQAFAAKAFARVLGSAFKTMGHPGDPSYAFASSLVDSALQSVDLRAIDTSTVYHDGDIGRSEIVVGAPVPPVVYVPPVADNGEFGDSSTAVVGSNDPPPAATTTAFDDDGNLMPGVVDSTLPFSEQQVQLAEQLRQQGVPPEQALQLAQSHYDDLRSFEEAFVTAQASPVLVAGTGWTPQVRSARETIDSIEARIASGGLLGGGEIGNAMADAYDAYLRLAATTDFADAKPSVDQEAAAARLVGLISDLGEVAKEQNVELTDEQSKLVRLAKTYQMQRDLTTVYGAGAAGGILALRQNPRLQALEAWAAKPYLRHPDTLIGKSDGGPGSWQYTTPRLKGVDYQEQVTGVPRNIEYRVNGRDFDGYDATRNVLLDSKHWDDYPPPGAGDWWKANATKEALGQLNDAAGTGARIEWQVSTEYAAEQIRALFGDEKRIGTNISTIVVPKK